MPNILSFDAESDGLWGSIFAVAGVLMNEHGRPLDCATFQVMEYELGNKWVKENVLPVLGNRTLVNGRLRFIAQWSDWYKQAKDRKEGTLIVSHMPYIVEARLLRDMFNAGQLEEFGGPYPLRDVAGLLEALGEDPTSVDAYVAKHRLGPIVGNGPHDPLYDAHAAGLVYLHASERLEFLRAALAELGLKP